MVNVVYLIEGYKGEVDNGEKNMSDVIDLMGFGSWWCFWCFWWIFFMFFGWVIKRSYVCVFFKNIGWFSFVVYECDNSFGWSFLSDK